MESAVELLIEKITEKFHGDDSSSSDSDDGKDIKSVARLGSTAIGIKTKDGVVLAVEKRITLPLLDVIEKPRVSRLDMEERIQKLAKWIKRSTQLKKLMNTYCDRQSVDFNSIALLFDGRRLHAEQTPDEATSHEDFRVLGVSRMLRISLGIE
ncbi:hypothetical protein BUALT_Bualt06G0013800 [Buddleja alternifolia]|uniref:Rad60/SUMO-like domain-containing protein n=1 Tax=Buddleja alternifolia TaxID=168488 RepID=A0AAV6XMQ2_9LAMI|nr:hypothetical protein BUALT_Bualt06G0013800 [Buddleja alternifolia]